MWIFIHQNSGQIGVLHHDHLAHYGLGGPDMLQSAGLQIRPRERCGRRQGAASRLLAMLGPSCIDIDECMHIIFGYKITMYVKY
jgi:hypothetical protein